MTLWTPAEITTGLWHDIDDDATRTVVSGISLLLDKKGNGINASQSNTSFQPTLSSGALNGTDVAGFNGDNQYWLLPTGFLYNLSAFSFFMVRKGIIESNNAVFGPGSTNSTGLEFVNTNVVGKPTLVRINNSEKFTTGVWATDSTYSITTIIADATSTVARKNGTLVGSASGISPLNFNGVYAIGAYSGGQYSNQSLAEYIFLPYAADAETIAKIEGYLAWRKGLQDALSADHPYKSAAPTLAELTTINRHLAQPYTLLAGDPLNAASEQLYSIAAGLDEVALAQLYSMLMETWIAQYYGDVPVINRSLIQPYRSAPVLNKSLTQRWADALQLERSLLQEWSMPGPLEASNEQRYGICAEVLELTCEQLYSINERTTLFAGLIQPYALAGEAARLYQFDIKLYLDGLRIPYHSLEWQAVDSESAWSCDFAVKSQAVALRCVDGAAITIVSAWDTWQLKVSGGWSEDKRHGSTLYRVRGYSRTKGLDQALPLLGDLPAGMASQLVAGLAAPHGISVDWRMADGYLAAGKVTANNQTPMAVIKDIVHDARGIVLSTMDGNLLIVAEEETPIPDYPTVTPADTIIARLERISTSSQPDEQRGYNRFKVSDQLASGDGFRWDTVLIDARTKEARLFVVPFDPLRRFALTHSGGGNVSIEPFGLVSLQVPAEQVEFVAGSSKTRLPIYGDVSYNWRQADLGAVSHAEDGLLTAATPGESLLSISYRTQYYRWIVRDPHVEDVQIIFNEVTA